MKILKFVILPMGLYLIIWGLMSWPAVTKVETHLLAGSEDGLQNYWSMWWVNQAVTSFKTNYWQTTWLYYPFGVSLYGHALSPINGWLSIPLSFFMPLHQAYNVLLILSFGLGGLIVFWLFYTLYKAYIPALLAGFIFTFAPNHFAQAQEHMEMLAVHWMALYALLLVKLLHKPNLILAILTAVGLKILMMDTPYFFFNGMILTLGLVTAKVIATKQWRWLFQRNLMIFGALGVILNFNFLFKLNQANLVDPLAGYARAEDNALDLYGFFIPGRIWRWGHLTETISIKTQLITERGSQYLGWSIIGLIMFLGIYEYRNKLSKASRWWFLLGFTTLLALGPYLKVGDKVYYQRPLPYLLLEKVMSSVKSAGKPVRMMVVINLAAAMLAGLAIKILWKQPKTRWIVGIVMLIYSGEVWPLPQPATNIEALNRPYLKLIKGATGEGSVLDETNLYSSMYQQTLHGKPLVEGYLARYPQSIGMIKGTLEGARMSRDWFRLCQTFKVRWFITKDKIEKFEPVYTDNDTKVYDLTRLPECKK